MSGQKILDGLCDAAAGNFARVTINGQTWARIDSKGDCRNGNTSSPLDGWRIDIENMPKEGRFEVLSAQPEVFRHLPNEEWVIIPQNGRMFKPYAWRAAISSHQRGTNS